MPPQIFIAETAAAFKLMFCHFSITVCFPTVRNFMRTCWIFRKVLKILLVSRNF